MELWKPTGISFSMGGSHVVALLGVLARLMDSGVIDDVRNWYGCSAGSICAFLGALGVSPTWIREMITYFDMRVVAEIDEGRVADFLNSWGINSGDGINEIIGRFLDTWEPGSSAWTFADLTAKRPGYSLTITATNLTEGTLTVFSTGKTSGMRILDAIRASSCIPLLITPWTDARGNMYCDGGAMEYFPWSCVRDKRRTLVVVTSDLGICRRKLVRKNIRNIYEYMDRIMKLLQQNQWSDVPKYWIAINNTSVDPLDFNLEKEERLALFQDGITAASGWLKFRETLKQETAESLPPSGGQCTLFSSPPSLNKTSGTRLSHNPPTPPCHPQGLHSEGTQYCRRWSL